MCVPALDTDGATSDDYGARLRDCRTLMSQNVERARTIIEQQFKDYGLSDEEARTISGSLMQSKDEAMNFLLKHHYEVTKTSIRRGIHSGLTMGGSYLLGGILPLIPYFIVTRVIYALIASSALMAVVLFTFGWLKTSMITGFAGKENVKSGLRGGICILIAGGASAVAALFIVRGLNSRFGLKCGSVT